MSSDDRRSSNRPPAASPSDEMSGLVIQIQDWWNGLNRLVQACSSAWSAGAASLGRAKWDDRQPEAWMR